MHHVIFRRKHELNVVNILTSTQSFPFHPHFRGSEVCLPLSDPRLKNERGERLSSHRRGRVVQFVQCSKIFSSLGFNYHRVCSQLSLPLVFHWLDFMPNTINVKLQ